MKQVRPYDKTLSVVDVLKDEFATTNTANKGKPIDIVEAMTKARQMLDMSRTIPASFKMFPADLPRFEASIRDLTHVKTDNKGKYEFQGIKIIEDESVPLGFIHVCNSDGEVLQRYSFD